MKVKFLVISVWIIFSVALFSRQAFSQEKREDPGEFLENKFAAGAEELKKESSSSGRAEIVKKFIQPVMDIAGIGLSAIGKLAKAIPPKEKNEYIERFTRHFFLNNSAIDILASSSETKFVRNKKATIINGDHAKVFGKMYVSGQKEYDVWFSMCWNKEKKIWIVSNSGVETLNSTVSTYQTEFNRFINNDPEQSIKAINGYLDCRLDGRGEKECQEREIYSAVRKGDN